MSAAPAPTIARTLTPGIVQLLHMSGAIHSAYRKHVLRQIHADGYSAHGARLLLTVVETIMALEAVESGKSLFTP